MASPRQAATSVLYGLRHALGRRAVHRPAVLWLTIAFCLLQVATASIADIAAVIAPSPVLDSSTSITLNEAVSDALRVDPGVRAAAAGVMQAQAGLGVANSGKRLQITFTSAASGASADVYQPPPSHETFGSLQDSVTVPVPVGRRPDLATEQAQGQVATADAGYRSARLGLAGN